MRKKGFILIELLVVIAIIAMLLAILMPALNKVKKIAMRVVCATNLKGMGTAQMVYANDYDDDYAVQGGGGLHNWAEGTDQWQIKNKNWRTDTGGITVGASLFLLVREADVSPKSFICPSSDQLEFTGENDFALDIIELWDFGHPDYTSPEGPGKCVSYSYHMPYAAGQASAASTGSRGTYAADGTRSASFAMMADKNPYFDEKLTNGGANEDNYMDRVATVGGPTTPPEGQYDEIAPKWRIWVQNAQSHGREGQNILFGDGHASHEKRADVGVKNDNIYTRWSGTTGLTEEERRRGQFPTAIDSDFAPLGADDSVLVNDDRPLE